MSVPCKELHSMSLLYEIEFEFQSVRKAYRRWMMKGRKSRSSWDCIGGVAKEDPLEKVLSLGRKIQKVISDGQESFGSRFEKGDTTTHTILAAQIHRIKHEIALPLFDCMESRISIAHIQLPYTAIFSAAHSIRRAVLHALHDQLSRLHTSTSILFLPPPRFSVKFCPYALQLQQDKRQGHLSVINAQKLHPKDMYDDREICPACTMHITVTAHSGLPNYRRLLFASHTSQPPSSANRANRATFACESCYKTFDESYAFLDHIFQKEIGSKRSCLRSWKAKFIIRNDCIVELGGDAELVEKCLKSCLQREMTRKREGKLSLGNGPSNAIVPGTGSYFSRTGSMLKC